MKQGFTLLELSIVLVIIGLIIGGVTAGKSLIRSAELNNILKERDQFQTAAQTFRLKYNALPGDMSNATSYWGNADTGAASGGECADPLDDIGTGTQTCNGNGSGILSDPKLGNAFIYEHFRFWQHLSNSEIITGSYTGTTAINNDLHAHSVGVNSPEGSISGTGWGVSYIDTAGNPPLFDGNYGNSLILGGEFPNWHPVNFIMTPVEIKMLDRKADDGVPGRGSIRVYWRQFCTDSTSTSDFDSDYLLSLNEKRCVIIFANAF